MTIPGKRLSSRHRKTRAAHFALKKVQLSVCPKCKKPILPHNVCKNCGYYRGRDVLKLEAKLDKKAKKKLQKQKAQEQKEAEKANKK